MESGKLVVSELLAFLQHQLEIMDEASVTQICVSNFSEEEIRGARTQLYDSLHLTDFKLSHRRSNMAERCLQDIIMLLRDTNRKFLPTFVAKDLRKLPPVTFDNVYVTRLLKDLTTMKTSHAAMNFKLESYQRIINDLHNEVVDLRNNNAKVCESQDETNYDLSNKVNSLLVNEQLVLSEPPSAAKPTWAEQCQPIMTNRISPNNDISRSHPVNYQNGITTKEITPENNRSESRSINDQCQTNEPEIQTAAKKKKTRKNKKPNSTSQSEHSGQPDPEGFVKVEKKKKAPVERSRCLVKIIEPPQLIRYVPLYLVRLHPTTNIEHVVEYLRLKTTWILKVEKLESRNNTTFNSFRIWVPSQHVSRFLKENYWPKGSICRRGWQKDTIEQWDKSVPPPVLNVLDNKL